MKSRYGRHTATASTWLLRHGLADTREEAVKLVKRGRVWIDGQKAQTRVGYRKPDMVEIGEKATVPQKHPTYRLK